MKTKSLLFILAAFVASLFTLQANAKIWRVNKISDYVLNDPTHFGGNMGGTFTRPVFAELSDAEASNLVSDGDTIHLEACPPGSGGAYALTHITKRLIIIGAGYFLDENPNTSNNSLASRINYITFQAGSAGSQLIGIWVYSSDGYSGGFITINENNILVKRCKIDDHVFFYNGLSDFVFDGNYFDNIVQPAVSCISISASSAPVNLILKNNIFKKPIILTNGTLIGTIEQCNNNVFDCPPISGKPSLQFNANECRNNIIKSPGILVDVNGSNTNFTNNTSAAGSQLLGTDVSNVNAADINSLFVASGTSDGKYMLNPSSPDNIPGYDGTERGAFGGVAITDRYTLSGLANIPVIYSITTSGTTSTDLPVTIKARTIK